MAVRLLPRRLHIVRTCEVNFPLRLRANAREAKNAKPYFADHFAKTFFHLLCVFPVVEAEYGVIGKTKLVSFTPEAVLHHFPRTIRRVTND
jgi:hypothetical protein